MNERLNYEVGSIVMPKKPHLCGSSQWEVLRVGADLRPKYMGCGHQIMVARRLVKKNTRGLTKIREDSQAAAPEDTVRSATKIVRK